MKWFRLGSGKSKIPRVDAVHNLPKLAESQLSGLLQQKTSNNAVVGEPNSVAKPCAPPPTHGDGYDHFAIDPNALSMTGGLKPAEPADLYNGPGYGCNLLVLPGTTAVPNKSVKEQRLMPGDALEIVERHPKARKGASSSSSKKGGSEAKKSGDKNVQKNEDGRKISIAKKTSPPPNSASCEFRDDDSSKVSFWERTYILRAKRCESTPGFLSDHDILAALREFKALIIAAARATRDAVIRKNSAPEQGPSTSEKK